MPSFRDLLTRRQAAIREIEPEDAEAALGAGAPSSTCASTTSTSRA